jgi:hypothetical protein
MNDLVLMFLVGINDPRIFHLFYIRELAPPPLGSLIRGVDFCREDYDIELL